MIYRSRILGTGSYLPPKVVTNDDLKQFMDTTDEWIQQRTGIRERHWVESNVDTSDLALEASKAAITNAGLSVSDIDMIILGTLSPDHDFPGTACFLQKKLGIPGIPAIDIRQQCTGFIYGISIADAFVRMGTYKHVLVVGAEVHSKGLDISTRGRDVSVLFGDGSGAVVIGRSSEESQINQNAKSGAPIILSTHLHADGTYAEELWLPAPGSAYSPLRINKEQIENGDLFPKMNGKTVFIHASKRMPEALHEALNYNQLKMEDIDLFVPHQANIRINEMVAKQCGIPEEKVFNTIQRFGNTTAGSIPIGLDTAVKEGRLKPGMLVATAAFGSGFTWASALIRW